MQLQHPFISCSNKVTETKGRLGGRKLAIAREIRFQFLPLHLTTQESCQASLDYLALRRSFLPQPQQERESRTCSIGRLSSSGIFFHSPSYPFSSSRPDPSSYSPLLLHIFPLKIRPSPCVLIALHLPAILIATKKPSGR